MKIELLGFEIWHYGRKPTRNFPEFSTYFSVFIIHSFYVSHSGLIKLIKSFSFCKIFQAPQKYLNMQNPKDAQNGLKLP